MTVAMVQLRISFVPLVNDARCVAHEVLHGPVAALLAAVLLFHVL